MAKKFTKRTPGEDKIKKAEEFAQELHNKNTEKETPPPVKKERISFNLRMPSHIYDQLTDEKERTGMSRAAIIYQALSRYFSNK